MEPEEVRRMCALAREESGTEEAEKIQPCPSVEGAIDAALQEVYDALADRGMTPDHISIYITTQCGRSAGRTCNFTREC